MLTSIMLLFNEELIVRFSTLFLDEICDRVPISTIVGRKVTFDRKKTNQARGDFWACCPFHGEKSPSFHCEDQKGRYHCFGCGVSGNHFKFLTEQEGLSFPEAVELVADLAGVAMPARDIAFEQREKEQASLFDVIELAVQYFEEQLQSAAGAKARGYLRDRGLLAATQHQFRLGYALESRNSLKTYLSSKNIPKDRIEACGLVVFGEDIPVSYDRFRDRIMFPIPDARGRTIAFGGRALSKDAPAKYLNSPETELFHKGNVLFNFLKARKPAQDKKTVIAVEGYMDVIALAQAGIHNAVAPLGTALTERQAELLWKMAPEPILCFDGDQAGTKASWRAADLIVPMLKPGKSMRFALLPEGKDPDDLVKSAGAEGLQSVLNDARPLIDLIWMRETNGVVFDAPERRAELEKRLREITNRIKDDSVRRHYNQDMRDRLSSYFGSPARKQYKENYQTNNDRSNGSNRMATGRIAVSDSLARSAMVRGSNGQPSLREAAILMMVVSHPMLAEESFETFSTLDLSNPDLRMIHNAILDCLAHHITPNRDAVISYLQPLDKTDIFESIELMLRRAHLWVSTDEAVIEDARQAFLQALHLHHLTRTLQKELKLAEIALATDANEENYARMIDIHNQMRNAQSTEALIEGFGLLSGRIATN
jgi:DNA primase